MIRRWSKSNENLSITWINVIWTTTPTQLFASTGEFIYILLVCIKIWCFLIQYCNLHLVSKCSKTSSCESFALKHPSLQHILQLVHKHRRSSINPFHSRHPYINLSGLKINPTKTVCLRERWNAAQSTKAPQSRIINREKSPALSQCFIIFLVIRKQLKVYPHIVPLFLNTGGFNKICVLLQRPAFYHCFECEKLNIKAKRIFIIIASFEMRAELERGDS